MSALLTIFSYDLKRFVRDRLMFVFSIAVLIMYVVLVWAVPDDIQPTWNFASTEEGADLIEKALAGLSDGKSPMKVVRFQTEAELKEAFSPEKDDDDDETERKDKAAQKKELSKEVKAAAAELEKKKEDLFVGFAFPKDTKEELMRGERVEVRFYVDESMPPENQELAEIVASEIALSAVGMAGMKKQSVDDLYLGPKKVERSFKDLIRSMMALLILVMEMLALASLLSREIGSGTVHAILTTTVSLPVYFSAKIAFGVFLAFGQAWCVTLATGALAPAPLMLTAFLFVGGVFVAACGIVVGVKGHDLMEVLTWGAMAMLPMLIPSFTAIMPGAAPMWVQAIPTYPLVMGLITAGDVEPVISSGVYLGWFSAWTLVSLGFALWALRRRLK
ncbi:MAG: ABC transporter permease [Deltaproteobacteria bacterium]|nr:ABC transporter permease [Deltaproteobacteria bacterium]